METTLLSPIGTDLASRRSAAQLRHNVVSALKCGNKVIFDLSGVVSISESYADELFGVLVLEYGIKDFFTVVSIRGASPNVLRRIADAIKERSEHQKLQDTIQTLVAAKHVKRHKFCGINS